MVELGYATVDADNHYYEPVDAFTRHIERDKAHLAFHLEVLDGVEQPVIDGRSAATFVYGGFFRDHIARPGSQREMLRNIKKGAMTDKTVKMRVNVAGYTGKAVSLYCAYDAETDVLLIAKEGVYEAKPREGFLRVTNQDRDET